MMNIYEESALNFWIWDKQLVNFITCTAAASRVHPNRARTHTVLVIGLYELLDPTT